MPEREPNPEYANGEVAADIADTEAAIARLNAEATGLVDTEAPARILLRTESVASSCIEGLEVGTRRLLRAEAARGLGDDSSDVTAVEVLGNIDAMVFAVEHIGAGSPITVELVLDVHQRLLAKTRPERSGGNFLCPAALDRGQRVKPGAAAFVPPPP